MDNKIERKCVLCKKKIKRFSKWNDNKNRSVHRKCWLDFRTFGDRYADFLFCGDRKEQNKVIKVKPIEEHLENIDKDIDETIEKINSVIDIGGNQVPIS
tara:strand:- start:6476 stop:6772 length:297 start_codon:yes stop_codon:yes gene_type:complete